MKLLSQWKGIFFCCLSLGSPLVLSVVESWARGLGWQWQLYLLWGLYIFSCLVGNWLHQGWSETFHDMFHLLLEKRHVSEWKSGSSNCPEWLGFSLMGDTAAQLHIPYHPNVQRKCSFKIFLMWSWSPPTSTWLVCSMSCVFRRLFLTGKFPIHLDFLLFSHFSWSGSVEVPLWTCGDSGRGRGVLGVMVRWLDSPGLCLIGAGLVWSDPCTCVFLLGYCLILLPRSSNHVLTVCLWGQSPCAWQPPSPDPRALPAQVTGSLSISEFHHQGMKKYADPQLTQCQLWKVRTSMPGLSNYIPTRPVLFLPITPCGSGYGTEWQLLS